MLDDHHARLILDQFEAVIHQVLRSYQVDPRSADYPDYVQELRIKYWIYRALIDDQLSRQEIQDQLGIKRSTYYKYRQAIQRKLADFYPQLKQCVDTF